MTEAQKYLIDNNQHDLVINDSKIAIGKDTNYRYLSDIMEEYANKKVKAEADRIKSVLIKTLEDIDNKQMVGFSPTNMTGYDPVGK